MVNNDALPDIEVDPETFAITIDGERSSPPRHRAPAGPALLDVLRRPMDTLAAVARRRPAARGRAHPVRRASSPLCADGLDPADLPAYCRTRLATVTRIEAATAVVARHQRAGSPSHWTRSRPPGRRARPAPRCGPPRARWVAACCVWRAGRGRWPSPAGRPRAAPAGARAGRHRRGDRAPGRSLARLRRLRRRPDRARRRAQAAAARPGRGGRLGASALLPAIDALADEVADLTAPDRDPGHRGHPRSRSGQRPTPARPGGCSVPETPSRPCGSESADRSVPARAR